jgi:hypothetical protein
MSIRPWIACATACALASAGCGGAAQQAETTTPVTVSAYGVVPATTVESPTGEGADARACRGGARAFVEDAVDLLAHFGPRAAYPADLNYVIVRGDLATFRASRCDLRLLGRALRLRLTAKQREDLVADLPRAMGATVRAALARAGST